MMARETRERGALSLETTDPQRIGPYEILAKLGVGGMGTVYLGKSPLDEHVAIKLVHRHLASDEEFRARFAKEAKAGQRVPAFCSARVMETGTYENLPYLVTEYIKGEPLSQMIALDGPLDLSYLHSLALGTAAGLVAIHETGLVHRDIKPSNIIMALGGVRIIDFGIARALDETHGYTRTGIVMGSLGWAAPEQLEGHRASQAMDIFAWGCVIAYASTGRHPFGPGGIDTRAHRVLTTKPNIDGVPPALRDIVEAALRRKPSDRPTAQEVLLSVAHATPQATGHRPGILRQRSTRIVAAVLAAVLLVFGLAVGLFGTLMEDVTAGRGPSDNQTYRGTAPEASTEPNLRLPPGDGTDQTPQEQGGQANMAASGQGPAAITTQGTTPSPAPGLASAVVPSAEPTYEIAVPTTVAPTRTKKSKKAQDDDFPYGIWIDPSVFMDQ